MRIVVVGRTRLICSKVVTRLRASGCDAALATPGTGCDALADEGLTEAASGADVLVDMSSAPWSDATDLAAHFVTSTGNLLAAARRAGVGHYVALSVVGGDRLPGSDYLRARAAQERLVAASGLRYSIVRATHLLDYARVVREPAAADTPVRVLLGHLQPIGSGEIAGAVARRAAGGPVDGVVEAGWPEQAGRSAAISA
ncbi:NAD(P)H-binding protein [Promicromonospora sp. MEB111]|uniref:SDR family oxidoreductase n=1 Tax=Promicromonospora sp. MEB111 TaxID=3040301 RepID=UPI00254C0D24|nr:NAD(P)H-binding protein [Promicromonospora sp. MEB111]